MDKIITIPEAMQVVTDAIRNDPGYREGWKANIAMAFKDEFQKETFAEQHVDEIDLHEIANKAADNFLDILIHQ